MLDARAAKIADEAVAGRAPSRSDVVYLLRFDAYSGEAAYVCAKARELGMRACGGRGYVYAQIGVDATPCPENCRFCSFAAINVVAKEHSERQASDAAANSAVGSVSDDSLAPDGDPDVDEVAGSTFAGASGGCGGSQVEVPIGRIVHYAKLFDDAGVDLISLMATAGLPFGRYLDMVRAVRASVSDHVMLMANTGDLTLEQAQQLKDAGATAAYHALRLREGELTDVAPVTRRRTMRHLHAAGIPLMTGVEPLWRGIDALELSERICDIPEFGPFAMGACALTEVDGLDTDGLKPALTGFVRYVGAITRLVCGESVPVGGIGGVAWVDAGCDPRNRGYGEDDATLRKKVAAARRRLQLDGFTL